MTLKTLTALSLMFISACALVTPPPEPVVRADGNDLVINEVFTLPPDRYYAYSWIELFNPTERSIPWFDQSYPASINVIGQNGTFIQTENDGKDWFSPSSVPGINYNGMTFPYPDTGYAVGDNGVLQRVIRTNDEYQFVTPGGLTATCDLNAVSALPATGSRSPTAIVVGDCGTILRTISTGFSWDTRNSGVTTNLLGVDVLTVPVSFVCGEAGTILRSINAGTSWLKITLAAEYDAINFHSIRGTGSLGDSVWVVGDGGTILGSRNATASATFFPETTNTTANLKGLFMLRGTNFGWAVGENGTILRRDKPGKRWDPQTSGTTATLRSVSFVDSLRGWITGDNGLILGTTNGGRRWTTLSSGTSNTLTAIHPLPLNIRVLNRYILQMWAKRKEFFFDLTTGTINFDYIVKKDTGYLYFDPEILFQNGVGTPPPPIPRNGFVILNSDSARFEEHTDIGPGKTNVLNVSIGYYFDPTTTLGVRPVLWDLLEGGEVRLVKQFLKFRLSTNEFLDLTTETVDVVRWGGFVPTPADFPIDPLYPTPPTDKIYPQNIPAGTIPEWWSLARYGDDVGEPVNIQSTAHSFYMSETPVPGYYSQLKRDR